MKTKAINRSHETVYQDWEKTKFWQKLIQDTKRAARLTDEELVKLEGNLAARIIAITALLSGCHDPCRISVAHLTTFIASIRCRTLYRHKTGETLKSRLQPIYHFPGGDPDIVQAGMLLLELLSLNDHKNDLADDIMAGKQNPLILEMDYKGEKNRLIRRWHNIPAAAREKFGELYEKTISAWFWF